MIVLILYYITTGFLSLFCLLLVQRICYQYYKKWYYERQGMLFIKNVVPLLGNLLRLFYIEKVYALENEHPGTLALVQDYGTNQPSVVGGFLNYYPVIMIRDAEIMNELYVTKNKYFDKHPLIKNVVYPLMGDSILLSESTSEWSKKRKVLSVAFYKEKLVMMCEIVKGCMAERIHDLKAQYLIPNKQMDLISEISKTFVKIILTCAFGEDLSDVKIEYIENGKKGLKPVSFVLRETFHKCLKRWHTLQLCIFPETVHWYLFASDRENRYNIEKLRELFAGVVKRRREGGNKDKHDLLAILLSDELFKDDEKMILDECLTFFFAATETSSMTT